MRCLLGWLICNSTKPTTVKIRNGQPDRVTSHSAVATTAVITAAGTAALSHLIPGASTARRHSGCRYKPTTLTISRTTARTEKMIASTRAVGCRLGSDPAAFTSNGPIASISAPTVPAIEPVPAHHGRFRRPGKLTHQRNLLDPARPKKQPSFIVPTTTGRLGSIRAVEFRGLHTVEVERGKLLKLWWVQAVIFGVQFGVVTGLFAAHRGHGSSVADGLITGSIGGVVFGLAMGWGTRRQQVAREQRTAAFTAGLTAERRMLAVRASRRGPVPDDPAIRAAAAGLTEDRLEQSISQRSKNLAIFGVIGLLELASALTSSPWYWVAALIFTALFVAQLRQPRTLRRRLALLSAAGLHQ